MVKQENSPPIQHGITYLQPADVFDPNTPSPTPAATFISKNLSPKPDDADLIVPKLSVPDSYMLARLQPHHKMECFFMNHKLRGKHETNGSVVRTSVRCTDDPG